MIKVSNLGKKYVIAHNQPRRVSYNRLSEDLAAAFTWPVRALRSRLVNAGKNSKRNGAPNNTPSWLPPREEFWALREVDFEVERGQVVGIIGRNGAGKSTLLKLLSRITEPTTGRIELHGRVASLLEVGTGFHPELTGRENIFLNGAILGMSRAEIKRKFDEIVAFTEIEKFLDTPVKRFSSGMYVRLAFAVAAHLEPEILVIDEVLAVGDAQFQRKCLGKMQDVAATEGRTVLFVSHNMNAVESLCTRAFWLDSGRIVGKGDDPRSTITNYLRHAASAQDGCLWINTGDLLDHQAMQPLSFAVEDEKGEPLRGPARNDEPLYVSVRADVRQPIADLNVGFALYNGDSQLLLWSLTTDGPERQWPKLKRGLMSFRCQLPRRFLNEGTYRLEMIASLHGRDFFVRPGYNAPAIYLEIRGGLSDSPFWIVARPGILAPQWSWESVPVGLAPSPELTVKSS
jgi:lipopolysaccharide transport system ATP-binding protein